MQNDIIEILTCAMQKGSSDIHLSVGSRPVLRTYGVLQREEKFDEISAQDMKKIIDTIMPQGMEPSKGLNDNDFAYRAEIDGQAVRFRVNLFRESGNFAIAMRVINTKIKTLEDLCLPKALKAVAALHDGLFLVTGSTGSGKSTTLAAIINEINVNRSAHIVTVEDPIEYVFEPKKSLIHQREIGRDVVSFASALRGAMRQDPDVIMIGEMRDFETVSAAISAAETGHFVLATLHTRDAAESVSRIIDMYPPHQQQQARLQLSSLLSGVLTQRLLPGAQGGRVAATELLLVGNAVRNYIREGKIQQIPNAISTGGSVGMHTMAQDIERLTAEHKIKTDTTARRGAAK